MGDRRALTKFPTHDDFQKWTAMEAEAMASKRDFVLELDLYMKSTTMGDIRTITPAYSLLVHRNASVLYDVSVSVGFVGFSFAHANERYAQQRAAMMLLDFLQSREKLFRLKCDV